MSAVNIDDKQFEKAVPDLSSQVESYYGNAQRPLNKIEKRIYKNMKHSLNQIKLHQLGIIQLRDAKELLDEL